MNERAARLGLTSILVAFVVLASAYAYVTPTLEAPDEIYHYDYIRSLINTGRPPVLEKGSGKGFGHHAPLYYTYGALTSFWVGENDLELWPQRHNPFFGYRFGEVGRDNKNLYLHPNDDAFGSSDTWLGIRVVRWASVVLGAVTIWAIYRTGREVFPQRPEMALGAAGLAAFIPQFLFIAGAVNDDNGATLFGALALWTMVRIVRKGPNWRRAIGLGLTLGLGWLSKLTVVALVPTAGVAIALVALRERTWRELLHRGVVVFGVAALLIVPWLIRQTVLYGDPTGTSREISEWGPRQSPPDLKDLGPDLYWLRTSFWGRLGYNQIPLASWIYDLLDGVTFFAAAGLVYLVVQRFRSPPPSASNTQVILFNRRFTTRHLQFTVLIVALLFTFGPMIVRRFLRPMPNFGRYLFPMLPSIALLMVTGLSAWLPRRYHRYLAVGITAAMLALGIAGLTCFLAPAYARPPIYETESAPQPAHRLDWVYLEKGEPLARLWGYDLAPKSARPGETVHVTLYWEALRKTDANYTLFAQLFGREDAKVAQRDTYPGLGHYPTSFWQPGQVIVDEVPIPVASDAVAPTRLRLDVGLYQRGSGRLKTVDEAGNPVGATAGWLKLAPAEDHNASTAPPETETDYQLSDAVALIGYDRAQENETLRLALHWTCLAPMTHDYIVFVHLLDSEGELVAQADGPPIDGDYPTSYWAPGELITDERTLPVDELEPGVYQLKVGMYLLETGERLPAVDAAGERLPNDAIPLTEIDLP